MQVTQETRQVQVPYIDIDPPRAPDREERTIKLKWMRRTPATICRSRM